MSNSGGYNKGRSVTIRGVVANDSFTTAPCGFVHVQIGNPDHNGAVVLVPINCIVEEQDKAKRLVIEEKWIDQEES